MSEKELWGIVIYEIFEDGCLNGLWKNNKSGSETKNEIAKKIDSLNKDLIGNYNVAWMGTEEVSNGTGTLEIKKNDDLNSTYNLTWNKEFIGEGFKLNNKLIAVYWSYGKKMQIIDE